MSLSSKVKTAVMALVLAATGAGAAMVAQPAYAACDCTTFNGCTAKEKAQCGMDATQTDPATAKTKTLDRRAEAYASKNTVFDSLIDALGMGVGYTLAIILMAFFREFIGTGAFTFGQIFPEFELRIFPEEYAISLFQTPVGAFIVFALILAVIAFIKNRKDELKVNLAKQEKARKAAQAAAEAQGQQGGSK